MKTRRILFLSHSASLNGASILLLHQLQWLYDNSDYQLEVLADDSGPLLADFRAVGRTRVLRNPLSFLNGSKHRWVKVVRAGVDRLCLGLCLGWRRYDLIYVNTAASGRHLSALGSRHGALMWHIHELPYALRLILGEEGAKALLPTAKRLIAVSQQVADSLKNQFAVSGDRVDLIHGFVPDRVTSEADRLSQRERVFAEAGWPPDAFVVGGCGGLGWRKGSDLFLQAADRLRRQDVDGKMRFLWVGGSNKPCAEVLQFAHDVRLLGLESVCRRVASTSNVDQYYSAMDVFGLTSREDPFPLVMLEAAMHAVPTVCFASAGGGAEFVEDGSGVVVPYLDVESFARAVGELRAAPSRRERLGRAARRKVRLGHSAEVQGPKLLRSIERCLA